MLKDYETAPLWYTTEYLTLPARLEKCLSKFCEPNIEADAEWKIINTDWMTTRCENISIYMVLFSLEGIHQKRFSCILLKSNLAFSVAKLFWPRFPCGKGKETKKKKIVVVAAYSK